MFLTSKRTDEAYWNSYKLLEKQLIKLSHSICFDDEQIEVYSSEIADIINSACIKIESLAKDIYEEHIYPFQIDNNIIPNSYTDGKNKRPASSFNADKWSRDKWKYDYNCLVEIDKKFSIRKKIVEIKLEKFNFLKYGSFILPFYNISLNDCNGGIWEHSDRDLFKYDSKKFIDVNWCKSYQEIKHNYIQSIKNHGTIKNAIMVLSAFYLLAIYNSCLPAKYFEWDYKTDKYELDFGSELFSCGICNHTIPPFIIDSEHIKWQEKQKEAEEKSPLKERYEQQNILSDMEGMPFFIVLSEEAFTETRNLVSEYCASMGIEKFDIAPYKGKNGLNLDAGSILYSKIKRLINPPYHPSNIRIAFNNGWDGVYNIDLMQGLDYEKSKYKNRTEKLLLELKIGDIITAQLALNDFVSRAEVKEISEHTIKLSIKGNKEYTLSEPKGNIIYIKKLQA